MQHMTLLLFLLRSAFSLLLFTIYFAFLYYFIPGRHALFREELPGAILSSFLWISFSYLYSFYVDTWGTISSIYGSLTSIVFLMLWLYFCITFLFLGALLNKYLQTYHSIHPINDLRRISDIVKYYLKSKIWEFPRTFFPEPPFDWHRSGSSQHRDHNRLRWKYKNLPFFLL